MDERSLAQRLARLTPEQRAQLRVRLRHQPFPLTPAQFGIWLFEQLTPGTTAYHNPAGLRLRGPLHVASVRRALEVLQERHEALRVQIGEDDDGMPVQTVGAVRTVPLRTTDLSGSPAADRESRALAVAVSSAREPFDLTTGPLWRAALIRIAEDDHVLVVTFHHVISDGWSLMVVLREFVAAYEALSSGGTPRLPPLPRAYRDVLAEAGHLEEGQREELLDWWRDSLRGAPRRVQFPLGPSRDPGPAGAGVPVHLDEQVTAGLRRLCRTAGASLFTGVAAAFCGALHELTGQSDLVLTTPVATRTDPAAQGVVACLLNTVPVRVRVPTPPQPRALLAEAHRAVVAAVAHSAVPFASIIAAVGATDGGSVSNVMVLHGNAELAELQVGRLHLSRYRIPIVASKHDLALLVTPGARDVHGELEYRSAVFTPSTAERIGGMVLATARGMAAA